ncbi:hypothetical protein AGMMS49574_02010 [Bacteroidia bacterium]|nr:hypothetical protein AGMMS49574_02010 [Bacteroidia bacterium]
MKSVKFLFVIVALLFASGNAEAQFGKRLGKAVENAAKNATVRKAEQKTDEAVSKGIDKATDPNTYKDKDGSESKGGKKPSDKKQSGNDAENESGESADSQQDTPKGVKAAEMAYAKSDFVPGDEIIFDDPMDSEQLGEFPSQWDLYKGTSEVVSVNGKKAIFINKRGTSIGPLMKNLKNYLGDVFTVEFDFLQPTAEQAYNVWFQVTFYEPDKNNSLMEMSKASQSKDKRFNYKWQTSSGQSRGDAEVTVGNDQWQHFAISFNKRAWKVYVNGVRVMNVPNVVAAPGWFDLSVQNGYGLFHFTNFRIAKGAVPLYDRMMTDGKIITYGITFDVGKSTIKPESMGEINRIAKLMTDNPDFKFSVEGHTDNTGSAATNQTLSDARSKAVLDKLVETGVTKDRLTSAGKGQNSPIADNSTDEGRAKNRRVEFIKIN